MSGENNFLCVSWICHHGYGLLGSPDSGDYYTTDVLLTTALTQYTVLAVIMVIG